jgi:low temperature requirement protein LtrA
MAGERAGGPVGHAQLLGWGLLGDGDDLGATVTADSAGVEAAIAAVFGFVIAAGLWWLYFDFFNASPLGRRLLAPQSYAYGHLLIFAGITATGAGALLAIRAGGAHLHAGGRWALCGGTAAVLIAISAIQVVNGRRWRELPIASRLATATVLVIFSAVGAGVSAYVVTASVAVILTIAILTEALLGEPVQLE